MLGFLTSAKVFHRSFQTIADKKELETSLSLATFAAPRKTSLAYREYMQQIDKNQRESIVDQLQTKMDAFVHTLFANTLFDGSVDDVLTSIAQFIAFSQGIVHLNWDESDDSNPTIIRLLLDLARTIQHRTLATTLQLNLDVYPWLYHSLFLVVQDVFRQGCLLLLSSKATIAIMTTSIHNTPSSVFIPLIATYGRVKRDLLSIIDNETIAADSFRGRPASWQVVSSNFVQRPVRDPSSPALHLSDAKVDKAFTPTPTAKTSPGWLKLLDSTKSPRDFVPHLSEKICVYHCFEGFQCNRTSCPYKHLTGVAQLSKADQVILNKFILEHPNQFQVVQQGSKKPGVSFKKGSILKKS